MLLSQSASPEFHFLIRSILGLSRLVKRKQSIALLAIIILTTNTTVADDKACLRLWLIPFEPAMVLSEDADINHDWAESSTEGQVRILNYLPSYVDSFQSHSREFLESMSSKIRGQQATIEVLREFAEQNSCPVEVRFLQWGTLFREIEHAIAAGENELPHVMQMGSTWNVYFANKGLMANLETDEYLPKVIKTRTFRANNDELFQSLKWTDDYRFLYYWKRPLNAASKDQVLDVNTNSWQALIDNFASIPDDEEPATMAFTIDEFSANILHYYVPFIWAGPGDFFDSSRSRVDIASDSALRVPQLLAQAAAENPTRFVFPERPHPESDLIFIDGEQFRATLSTLNLSRKWYESFSSAPESEGKRFDDYAGVALPPTGFRGGSDLVVTHRAVSEDKLDMAAKLGHHLSINRELQIELILSGDWPAQVARDDLAPLLGKAWDDCPIECSEFIASLAGAIESANIPRIREYPNHVAFGRDMESDGIRQAVLEVWRRMGRYAKSELDLNSLQSAALSAETITNNRITRWPQRVKFWMFDNAGQVAILLAIITALVAFGTISVSRKVKALRARLDATQKLLTMAATTVRSLDAQHLSIRDSKHRAKRTMVLEALSAWTRAKRLARRQSDNLAVVITRAVVLGAARFFGGGVIPSDLATNWETSLRNIPPTDLANLNSQLQRFLSENNFAVDTELLGPVMAYIIDFPYLLEQALVCLIENTVAQADKAKGLGQIQIEFNEATGELLVTGNTSIPSHVCELINEVQDFDEFSERVRMINDRATELEILGEHIRSIRRSVDTQMEPGADTDARIDDLERRISKLTTEFGIVFEDDAELGNLLVAERLKRLAETVGKLPRDEIGLGLVQTNFIVSSFFGNMRIVASDGRASFSIGIGEIMHARNKGRKRE